MKSFNNIKKDFPIFINRPGLVYLDNAATSQKPKQIIKAVSDFYEKYNANVHRGVYDLSQEATDIFEGARKKMVKFIDGNDEGEIVFTSNASEAINLVAHGYGKKYLRSGDIVVTSVLEHHSNYVPWLQLREEIGIRVFFLPLKKNSEIDYEILEKAKIDKNRIKLVAVSQISNVLGTINPISEMVSWLKSQNIHAKILIDGAQSVPHIKINVNKLGCDFFVWSGHKMLGPSGIGGLWAKKDILNEMDPLMTGSHMIKQVSDKTVSFNKVPEKFETGTGRLEAAAGLGAAIDYLQNLGMKNIFEHEKHLTAYLIEKLIKIPQVKIYGSNGIKNRVGVVSFNIEGVHAHDTGEILNRRQICVRTGHHCAMPLLSSLGVDSTVRASLYIYNTKSDIDKLISGIKETIIFFKK
jgi:cysteine desulfurase / selenocysteine lyase